VGSLVFGDMEFALWVSKTQKDLGNFRIWFLGHGFQDLGFRNFRIWFSRLGISTLGPGFSHSRFPRPELENF
jgi:hypothetical protein